MLSTFFLVGASIGVIGVIIAEILLVFAMIRPNSRITTRKAGLVICFSFLLLTVCVAAYIFLNT